MSKPKKLTLSTLNKLDAGLNEKKVVYIIDGQYATTIDCKFRTTKIQKLTIDYLDYLNQLKSKNNVDTDTMMSVPILLYALVCKYFSDLPLSFDNIDELVDVTKKLLDLGIIEQLFSSDNGFDPIEIEKLNKEIDKIAKNVGQTVGEMAYVSALDEVVEDSEVGEESGE